MNINGTRAITAEGGNGSGQFGDQGKGGSISVDRNVIEIKQAKIEQNGNDGGSSTAAAPIYGEGETFWGGGGGKGQDGVTGYCKITYITPKVTEN